MDIRPFPLQGLLPKQEIQAIEFSKVTRGGGIRVAVIDSGVDPAAAGLTSRVVDLIDCTGTGDFHLQTVEPTKADNGRTTLPGLSGRNLLLNKSWSNPTSVWKVGFKRAFDLYPVELVARLKRERKQRFTIAYQHVLAEAQAALSKFNATKTGDDATQDAADGEQERTIETRKELENCVTACKNEIESFEDDGPLIDAVAWHDGKDWRSVVRSVDGFGDIDMQDCKPMTDFSKEKHFEQFDQESLLTYSVNFYEDGNLLSVVTTANAHGTHVASIIASNHPGHTELDGVAPEVEIVSLRIGDRRFSDGIETNQAIWRATRAILDTGCHLVNMSYGESGAFGMESRGLFIQQMIDEVIRKQGIPYCVSAGNNGPALSTVGWPAAADAVYSIGAWVSESMQQSEYALVDKVPASIYTWSSRGPLFNGSRGVAMYAPGGAITSTPLYTLNQTKLMNGTSMASPSACGAVALLMSAAKAASIIYTPASLLKAIRTTAKDVGDDLGTGLIQIKDAFEELKKQSSVNDVHAEWLINVTPTGRGEAMRGVYLRTIEETTAPQHFAVDVTPHYADKETREKYEIDMQLSLQCSAPYVEYPKFLHVNSSARPFGIRVDATQLDVGLHHTSIDAFTADGDSSRLIFSVPVTIIKPEVLSEPSFSYTSKFSPGKIERRFLQIPLGASWVELTLKSSKRDIPSQTWLHCTQIQDLQRVSDVETTAVLALNSNEPVKKRIKLTPGLPLELCLAQGWNSPKSTTLQIDLDFHGISIIAAPNLHVGNEISILTLHSGLRLENLADFGLTFSHRRLFLRPSKSTIHSAIDRNRVADDRLLFELALTFDLEQAKKTNLTMAIALPANLYDSAVNVLFAVVSTTGQVIQTGDQYPKTFDLDKGKYAIRAHLLALDMKTLETLEATCLRIDEKLDGKAKDVKLALYRDHVDAVTSAPAFKTTNIKLRKGEHRSVVIKSSLSKDVLEEIAKLKPPTNQLVGQLNTAPASYKVGSEMTFTLAPLPAQDRSKDDQPTEKPALLDLQLEMAQKIEDTEERHNFLTSLQPNNDRVALRLLVAKLESSTEQDARALKLAEEIVASIDQPSLSRALLESKTAKTRAEKQTAKDTEERKTALVKALFRRAELMQKRQEAAESAQANGEASTGSLAEVRTALKSLSRWQEADTKTLLLQAQSDLGERRPGSALLKLKKLIDDVGPFADDKMLAKARKLQVKAYELLQWHDMTRAHKLSTLTREPAVPWQF